jgi:thiamine-monophosphate kinase
VAKRRAAGEFELIAAYFRPLAEGHAGALGLADDAALVDVAPGRRLVVTADTIVAGVHFFPDDPPELIARKLLRVNLSDLAAMGARPLAYLVCLALPKEAGTDWLEAFCRGLRADQEEFGLALIGGDTVATPGPIALTLTALGEATPGEELRRLGAKPGDLVFVSGTIGDAALGLEARRGGLKALSGKLREQVIARYHLPRPRLELGMRLRGIARAALDISDGLMGDLDHVCAASGVGAVVEWPRVPLSEAARRAVEADPALVPALLAGGDDYELLFTAAPEAKEQVAALAREIDLPLTPIGQITEDRDVRVIDAKGCEIEIDQLGYRHF